MGHRFDAVAAGVQLFHEEVVVKLVRNWIEKTCPRLPMYPGFGTTPLKEMVPSVFEKDGS